MTDLLQKARELARQGSSSRAILCLIDYLESRERDKPAPGPSRCSRHGGYGFQSNCVECHPRPEPTYVYEGSDAEAAELNRLRSALTSAETEAGELRGRVDEVTRERDAMRRVVSAAQSCRKWMPDAGPDDFANPSTNLRDAVDAYASLQSAESGKGEPVPSPQFTGDPPPSIESLLDRSSLGTPEAKAIRTEAEPELVEKALAKVDEPIDVEHIRNVLNTGVALAKWCPTCRNTRKVGTGQYVGGVRKLGQIGGGVRELTGPCPTCLPATAKIEAAAEPPAEPRAGGEELPTLLTCGFCKEKHREPRCPMIENLLSGPRAQIRGLRERFAALDDAHTRALERGDALEREKAAILKQHNESCAIVQNCVQRFKLGLGGENIFELLAQEYERELTDREALEERLRLLESREAPEEAWKRCFRVLQERILKSWPVRFDATPYEPPKPFEPPKEKP